MAVNIRVQSVLKNFDAVLKRIGACLLIMLAVSGCTDGGEAGSDRRSIIVVAVPAGEGRRALLDELIAEFSVSHPHVDVRVLSVPGPRYYQKVLVMMASRTGPDIVWMGQSFSEFADRDAFLDLTPYIDADDVDLTEYHEQALAWYRQGDRQYAIPFGIDMRLIVYNKDLFDEAGVAYPTNEWTYEQFLAKATRLTRDRTGDGRIDQYGLIGELEPCLFGARVFDGRTGEAACNSPEMIDYLETNQALFLKHRVTPTPAEQAQSEGQDVVTLFRQGRAAMVTMATWNLPSLRRHAVDVRWDIVLNPKVRQRGQWASSQAYAIWRETSDPEACWAFYQHLYGPGIQRAVAFESVPTHMPTLREAIDSHRGPPTSIDALTEAMGMLYPTTRVANLQELYQLYVNARESVWAGRATAAEAMAVAERRINRRIERHRR